MILVFCVVCLAVEEMALFENSTVALREGIRCQCICGFATHCDGGKIWRRQLCIRMTNQETDCCETSEYFTV